MSDLFSVVSPPFEPTYEDLCRTPSQLFVLKANNPPHFRIRGGFTETSDGALLFLGSLVLKSNREVAELGLRFRDFPVHDPTVSSLSALQVQTSALKDVRRLSAALADALEQIKTLRGIVPMCAACKRIRDDSGYWHQVEVYVRDHTEAEFSHSICPKCENEWD